MPSSLNFELPLREQILKLCESTPNLLDLSEAPLDAKNVSRLRKCLFSLTQYGCTIHILKLNRCFKKTRTLEELNEIFNFLAAYPDLSEVDLSDNDFAHFDKANLMSLFKKLPDKLKRLSLAHNTFNLSTIQEFLELFHTLPKDVAELELSEDNFKQLSRDEIYQLLMEPLKNKHIITDSDNTRLAIVLKSVQEIQALKSTKVTEDRLIEALNQIEKSLQIETRVLMDVTECPLNKEYYQSVKLRAKYLESFFSHSNSEYLKLKSSRERINYLNNELEDFFRLIARINRKIKFYEKNDAYGDQPLTREYPKRKSHPIQLKKLTFFRQPEEAKFLRKQDIKSTKPSPDSLSSHAKIISKVVVLREEPLARCLIEDQKENKQLSPSLTLLELIRDVSQEFNQENGGFLLEAPKTSTPELPPDTRTESTTCRIL